MAPAARKKATKGSPVRAPRNAVSVTGEPTGRFAQILAETRAAGIGIDKFDITEELVLYPPRPHQVKAIDRTSAAHLAAQIASIRAVQDGGPPIPDFVPPAPDASPETIAAYAEAINAVREARKGWFQQQQQEREEIHQQLEAAETAYNEALMGGTEQYERVQEFFADRGDWERQAFEHALKSQFLRLPTDGRCQLCGTVVDEEAAGKELTSSTSSSTTGMSSRPTSPTTSEELTPETGSAEPAPGPSS